MDTFVSTILNGLLLGGVYSLLALGLVVLFKATGIVNLAHGGILALGAYIAAALIEISWMPDWLGIALTLLIGAILGYALYRFVMQPLIGQPIMVTVIVTLVIAIFIEGIILWVWQAEDKALSLFPIKGATFGSIHIGQSMLYSFGIAMLLFAIFIFLFRYTRIGLAMRCVSEDHLISQSLGISVKYIFALSWMIACTIAVVSGILYGATYSVNPSIGEFGIIKALPILLLGGMESIMGALIGGVFIGIVEMLTAQYVEPELGHHCRDVVAMVMMFAILIVRPNGIFGIRRIERI